MNILLKENNIEEFKMAKQWIFGNFLNTKMMYKAITELDKRLK